MLRKFVVLLILAAAVWALYKGYLQYTGPAPSDVLKSLKK